MENIRALKAYEITSEQLGPMLAPIILQKLLPMDIKLEVTRRLKEQDWEIDELRGTPVPEDNYSHCVRKHRLCFKCLGSRHNARKCTPNMKCFSCKNRNHHTAIYKQIQTGYKDIALQQQNNDMSSDQWCYLNITSVTQHGTRSP